jgi:exopolysaccharide biosynthesis operon protein EpsL
MHAHPETCSTSGIAVLRRLAMITLAAGPVAGTPPAHALGDGRLEPFVSHTQVKDDNVFRLSGDSDAASVLGTPSKGDTYRTNTAGLNFDLPAGRQRFLGGVWFNDNRYDQFTVLDFTERHGRATWQWQAGDDLSGRLGATADRALASLANIQGGVQLGTPNALDTRKAFLDAAYLLTPRWRLRAEGSRLEQANGVAERTVNDITSDGAGLELGHLSPAGNLVGLAVQTQDADLPNLQPVGASLVDNSYRQRRVKLVTDWTLSGHSRLSASAGKVSRRFVQLPERDFATGIFHATFEWKPTASFTLLATAQRDISAPDEINAGVNVGFVLAQGIALRPAYRLTEKLSVSGELGWSDWRYLGDPGMALGTVPPRSDKVRNAALLIAFQAMRILRLELGLRRETRTSTAALGDYEVELVSASARLAF